ncbi:MAG: hypothetical protein EA341_18660 [Mongoliibacter sp.]|uniref:hypothetical protein n=1 Tax=Mongoliibacter sp. TaxID=2022438 RepID=UPI0012EF7BA6|nr:hypothetical protein [Mongoliibacter sp.]TVP43122.1 MAG: hypothetical protein EA341_18660 [Mongoliibacter sp.]
MSRIFRNIRKKFLLERFTNRVYTQDSIMALLIENQLREENFVRNRTLNDLMSINTQSIRSFLSW